MTEQIIQGSPEWLQARCGSLGASAIQDALAKTKTGWGASREAVKARLKADPASFGQIAARHLSERGYALGQRAGASRR